MFFLTFQQDSDSAHHTGYRISLCCQLRTDAPRLFPPFPVEGFDRNHSVTEFIRNNADFRIFLQQFFQFCFRCSPGLLFQKEPSADQFLKIIYAGTCRQLLFRNCCPIGFLFRSSSLQSQAFPEKPLQLLISFPVLHSKRKYHKRQELCQLTERKEIACEISCNSSKILTAFPFIITEYQCRYNQYIQCRPDAERS